MEENKENLKSKCTFSALPSVRICLHLLLQNIVILNEINGDNVDKVELRFLLNFAECVRQTGNLCCASSPRFH